jgi:hypothetical protein
VIGRGRFRAVVKSQLDLFEQEHSDLLAACDVAEAAYNAAPREEAEERYGDYLDLLEAAAETLADMRDRYAGPLEEPLDDEYTAAFDRAAGRRYPRLAPHLG